MKTVFEVKKASREIDTKNKNKIEEGCTITGDQDVFDEIIETYETKKEALNALKKYKSSVEYFRNTVPFYFVTEYYVEENTYDDDGEWEKCGGIWKFAKLPTID